MRLWLGMDVHGESQGKYTTAGTKKRLKKIRIFYKNLTSCAVESSEGSKTYVPAKAKE